MRLFGLIGYPLTHSFSGKYFTEKFEKERIRGCRYELFPIAGIDELPGLLREHPDLAGLNITIPYKKQVLPFLYSAEGIPAGLNACNCIDIRDGNLHGYNTDTIGFEKSFAPFLLPHHTKALILGNGGVTAAVVYVLGKLGITFNIVSRELHHGSNLTYDQLTEEIMRENTIIINASPVGTYPSVNEYPCIPYEFIGSQHYLYDLVYNPSLSRFLQKGKKNGAQIRNGSDMLVIQAEESWKIWNLPH